MISDLRRWIISENIMKLSHIYKIDSTNGKKKNAADMWALSAYSDSWRLMVGGSEGVNRFALIIF